MINAWQNFKERKFGRILGAVWSIFLLGFNFKPALAEHMHRYNMPIGVTPISHDIYRLHMLIFYICVLIGVIVFGVLIYSLIEHPQVNGHKPADFHSSLRS